MRKHRRNVLRHLRTAEFEKLTKEGERLLAEAERLDNEFGVKVYGENDLDVLLEDIDRIIDEAIAENKCTRREKIMRKRVHKFKRRFTEMRRAYELKLLDSAFSVMAERCRQYNTLSNVWKMRGSEIIRDELCSLRSRMQSNNGCLDTSINSAPLTSHH